MMTQHRATPLKNLSVKTSVNSVFSVVKQKNKEAA
jgi:hypothetical protein